MTINSEVELLLLLRSNWRLGRGRAQQMTALRGLGDGLSRVVLTGFARSFGSVPCARSTSVGIKSAAGSQLASSAGDRSTCPVKSGGKVTPT